MSWTEKKVLLATEMWKKGHSAAIIARKIGMSRNAVIGKLHRMKLTRSYKPSIRRFDFECDENDIAYAPFDEKGRLRLAV